jgi:CelD/BcsL family acetyltransferase involved in cellulose biosynthesis
LLRAGLLRLHALRVDDALAAVAYVLVGGDRAHLYLVAFDPVAARFSPGGLVVAHAVDAAAAAGCRTFDFLRGREGYKLAFGAEERKTWRRRLGA